MLTPKLSNESISHSANLSQQEDVSPELSAMTCREAATAIPRSDKTKKSLRLPTKSPKMWLLGLGKPSTALLATPGDAGQNLNGFGRTRKWSKPLTHQVQESGQPQEAELRKSQKGESKKFEEESLNASTTFRRRMSTSVATGQPVRKAAALVKRKSTSGKLASQFSRVVRANSRSKRSGTFARSSQVNAPELRGSGKPETHSSSTEQQEPSVSDFDNTDKETALESSQSSEDEGTSQFPTTLSRNSSSSFTVMISDLSVFKENAQERSRSFNDEQRFGEIEEDETTRVSEPPDIELVEEQPDQPVRDFRDSFAHTNPLLYISQRSLARTPPPTQSEPLRTQQSSPTLPTDIVSQPKQGGDDKTSQRSSNCTPPLSPHRPEEEVPDLHIEGERADPLRQLYETSPGSNFLQEGSTFFDSARHSSELKIEHLQTPKSHHESENRKPSLESNVLLAPEILTSDNVLSSMSGYVPLDVAPEVKIGDDGVRNRKLSGGKSDLQAKSADSTSVEHHDDWQSIRQPQPGYNAENLPSRSSPLRDIVSPAFSGSPIPANETNSQLLREVSLLRHQLAVSEAANELSARELRQCKDYIAEWDANKSQDRQRIVSNMEKHFRENEEASAQRLETSARENAELYKRLEALQMEAQETQAALLQSVEHERALNQNLQAAEEAIRILQAECEETMRLYHEEKAKTFRHESDFRLFSRKIRNLQDHNTQLQQESDNLRIELRKYQYEANQSSTNDSQTGFYKERLEEALLDNEALRAFIEQLRETSGGGLQERNEPRGPDHVSTLLAPSAPNARKFQPAATANASPPMSNVFPQNSPIAPSLHRVKSFPVSPLSTHHNSPDSNIGIADRQAFADRMWALENDDGRISQSPLPLNRSQAPQSLRKSSARHSDLGDSWAWTSPKLQRPHSLHSPNHPDTLHSTPEKITSQRPIRQSPSRHNSERSIGGLLSHEDGPIDYINLRQELSDELKRLMDTKAQLSAEMSRIPSTGGLGRGRRRKEELDNSLDEVEKSISSVKRKMRTAGVL
ncbi:hypothetical protein DFS34DRAFT_651586 [Phlyctochytrium arcticum]|nr:hypothetical protein DFS34DRAFT_651586 [Phlyctochytrium arcticum]